MSRKMATTAAETLKQLIDSSKVLVLSKTTCGYCSKSKSLLKELGAKDVNVIELDTRADGTALQNAALDLTGQRTVPNIFIGRQHIGGNDKLQALHKNGELVGKLQAVSSL